MNHIKKPTLKDDEFAELRKWMLDVYNYLFETPNIRGDGNRLLVTQGPQGAVIKLLEDDYKKNFSFHVESQEGGVYSKNNLFTIRGGTVSKPGLKFELATINETIGDMYLYLIIKNIDKDEAAEIPEGEGNTQQDIDETENNFYAKFEITATKKTTPVSETEVNILIGRQINKVFHQNYIGDVYICGIGGGKRAYLKITGVTSPSKYTGRVQKGYFDKTDANEIDVLIEAPGITANPLSVGDYSFADVEKDKSVSPAVIKYIISVPGLI